MVTDNPSSARWVPPGSPCTEDGTLLPGHCLKSTTAQRTPKGQTGERPAHPLETLPKEPDIKSLAAELRGHCEPRWVGVRRRVGGAAWAQERQVLGLGGKHGFKWPNCKAQGSEPGQGAGAVTLCP